MTLSTTSSAQAVLPCLRNHIYTKALPDNFNLSPLVSASTSITLSVQYDAQRTRDQQRDSDEEFDSDAPEQDFFPVISTKMRAKFHLSETTAKEEFTRMSQRLEKYIESSGLLTVDTRIDRAKMERTLDVFAKQPDNARILNLFTRNPTKKQAIESMSDNLRNNVRVRLTGQKVRKLEFITPTRDQPDTSFDTDVVVVDNPVGAPKAIGLKRETILHTYDLGDSNNGIHTRVRVEDIFKSKAGELSVDDISWTKWLNDLEYTACLKKAKYSIWGLIGGNINKPTPIHDKTLFKRFLDMEGKSCGAEIIFGFKKCEATEAASKTREKQPVLPLQSRHIRSSTTIIRSRTHTPPRETSVNSTSESLIEKIPNEGEEMFIDGDIVSEALDGTATAEMSTNSISKAGRKGVERASRESYEHAASFFKLELFDLFDPRFQSDLQGMFRKSLNSLQLHTIYYVLHSKIMEKRSAVPHDTPGYGEVSTFLMHYLYECCVY